MSDDQVVLALRKRDSERVALAIVYAISGTARPLEHSPAQIHVVDGSAAVLPDQLHQKAPVAFAQQQHAPCIGDVAQKRGAAPLQRAPESGVFKPAIPARDRIAIQSTIPAMGRNSSGLSRAASARTRSASGDKRSRA